MRPDTDFDEELEDEEGGGFDDLTPEDQALLLGSEMTHTHYEAKKKVAIPQPDRAKSAPDLPRVKARTMFTRIIK